MRTFSGTPWQEHIAELSQVESLHGIAPAVPAHRNSTQVINWRRCRRHAHMDHNRAQTLCCARMHAGSVGLGRDKPP